MDFIKNLSLHDRAHADDDQPKVQPKAVEQPLLARSEPVPESSSFLDKLRPHHSESHDATPVSVPAPPPLVTQSPSEPHHEEKGLFDKIGDAFGKHNQAADGDQPIVTSASSKDKVSDAASRVPPNSHSSPVTSSTKLPHERIMDKFFGGNGEQHSDSPAPPVVVPVVSPAPAQEQSFFDKFRGKQPTPPPPPPPAVAAPAPEKHDSFFDKLRSETPPPPTPVVAAAPVPEKHDSFMDKLRGKTPPPPPVAVAAPAPEHEHFFDKLRGKTPPPPPVAVPAPEAKNEHFVDKLFGRTPSPPPPPPRDPSLGDKISDHFDRLRGKTPTPPPPPPPTGIHKLAHHVSGIFGGDDDTATNKKDDTKHSFSSFLSDDNKETKPQQSGGFMDTINGHLGGGAKGEAAEGKIDKAIDFVQEHVFGQGDQSNESAMEQMKDKQIANALRSGWGGEDKKE